MSNRPLPSTDYYAATHLLAEFWGGRRIENEKALNDILIQAATFANSTVLEVRIHRYAPQGITGFALLSDSHISLHSWPEIDYLAIDIFTCGTHTRPHAALDYLRTVYTPRQVDTQEIARGKLTAAHDPSMNGE